MLQYSNNVNTKTKPKFKKNQNTLCLKRSKNLIFYHIWFTFKTKKLIFSSTIKKKQKTQLNIPILFYHSKQNQF